MTQQAPPPGWYPNPDGHPQWWNGNSWGPLAPQENALAQDASSPVAPGNSPPLTRRELRASGALAPESSPSPPTRPVSRRKAARAAKPIYWSNLTRIRFWQFTLFGAFVIIIIPALLIPVWVVILPLYIIVFLLLSRFWLSQQMACHACGRILAATKAKGAVKICGRCGTPTDEGLAAEGAV